MMLRLKLCIILVFLSSVFTQAQNISGTWKGELEINKTTLAIVFNVKKLKTGYECTMDSPSQNAYGIPIHKTSLKDSIVVFEINNPKITYQGKLINNFKLIGDFKQGNTSIPLELNRVKNEVDVNNRPQEPKKPYAYKSEEVIFRNKKAKINLAGTLTIPKGEGAFPVVVLLSGSGPQDRNEEAFGHKPFLVLSDFLTKSGIAVLRYDDRGTAKSEGNYKLASLQDFASDAIAAIDYLKTRSEIDTNNIGIIGHSEGGTIAPMIAKQIKDLGFIISLAGTVLRGDEILLLQQRLGGIEAGASEAILEKSKIASRGAYDLILKHKNKNALQKKLALYLEDVLKQNPSGEDNNQEFIKKQITKLTSSWMTSFVRYNPSKDISKLNIPYLALFGDKDSQVPSKENLKALIDVTKSADYVKIMEFEDLNHMFQECNTGSPNEYANIKQTISPKVLKSMRNFIFSTIGK